MPHETPGFTALVKGLAGAIARLPPGDLAQLRRGGASAGNAVFWRLRHEHELKGPAERWEAPLQAIALLTPTGDPAGKLSAHDPGLSFGRALQEAGVSELRVNRLLGMPQAARPEALLRLVRMLAARDARFDLRSLLLLMLRDAESDRRRVADDYFAALIAAEKKEKKADA